MNLDWNDVLKGRKLAARDLPHLLKLPMAKSARDLMAGRLKDGFSVLDFGANDRNLEVFISKKGLKVEYSSFDVDRSFEHDYHDLGSVDGEFDAVAMLEVIEHMDVARVMECFKKVRDVLKPGGVFVVSTPNVCNPVVFWRDCTHITPFRYDELYGLLASTGFEEIEIYRCGDFRLKDRLLALYYRPLLRLMRMDYAPGIAAIARKR